MWFRDKKNRLTACRETWDIPVSFLEVVSHGGSNSSQRQTILMYRSPPQTPRSVSFSGPAGRPRTLRHCQRGLCQGTVEVDAGGLLWQGVDSSNGRGPQPYGIGCDHPSDPPGSDEQ